MTSEKLTEIKNPWCVYSLGMGWVNFGKIVEEFGTNLFIKYSEKQVYPAQCYNLTFVKRFSSLEETIDFYIKNEIKRDSRDKPSSPEEIREMAKFRFPSYFKKELLSKITGLIKIIAENKKD